MADNKIKIDVEVDDNGTTKKVGLESKKAGENLDKMGKSAHTTDRNLKGAAQASANGTKNFSKMAQGISGGIVPAYATLAAQVFALTAAFNFLKDAGNFAAMEAGQKAYASSTGVAMKTLANSIVAATDAQLDYRDAASAAAIGVASGLSTDQLTRLGGAAKDASLILGRDLTDSFNRLVRGATKAEPELLDELGIVLRLKPATEKYAAAIGKTAETLTAYERTQAVTNEILGQTEEKYSKILDIVDPATNSFNKFGKAFTDITNIIKKGVNFLLAPIAKLLSLNPFASMLIAAPLLNGLIKQIIPSFEGLGTSAVKGLEGLQESLEKTKKAAEIEFTSLKLLQGDAGAAQEYVGLVNEELVQLAEESETGFRGLKKLQEGGTLAGKTISQNLKAARDGTGAFADMTVETRQKYVELFENLDIAAKASTNKVTGHFNIMTSKIKLKFTELRIKWNQVMTSIVNGATKAANAIVKSFTRIASIVGIVTMVLSGIKQAVKNFLPDSVGQAMGFISKKLTEYQEKLSDLRTEYEDFIKIQRVLNNVSSDYDKALTQVSLSTVEAVGKVSSAISILEEQQTFARIMEEAAKLDMRDVGGLTERAGLVDEQVKRYEYLIKTIDAMGLAQTQAGKEYKIQLQGMIGFLEEAATSTADSVQVSTEGYFKAKSNFESFTAAVSEYIKVSKELPQQLSDAFDGLTPKTAYDSIIRNLEAQQAGLEFIKSQENGVKVVSEEEQKRVEINKQLLELFTKEQERLNNQAVATSKLALLGVKLSKGATSLQQQRNQAFLKDIELAHQLANAEAQINHIIETRILEGKNLNGEDRAALAVLEAQTQSLKEQRDILAEMESGAYKLGMAMKQSLETGLQTNIYDLLTGKESSLKDAMGKLAQSVFEGLAKELSNQLTEKIMGVFGVQTEEQKQKQLYREIFAAGSKDFETALKNGATELGSVIESKIQAYENRVTTGIQARKGDTLKELPSLEQNMDKVIYANSVTVYPNRTAPLPLGNKLDPNLPVTIGNEIKKESEETSTRSQKIPSFTPVIGQIPTGLMNDPVYVSVVSGQAVASVEGLGTRQSTTNLVKSSETQAIAANKGIDASETQVKASGKFDTAVEAFGQESKGLVAGLATTLASGGAVTGQALAGQLVSTAISAAFSAYVPAPVPARTGGILSSGSKIPGYAVGGVARGSDAGYPAILHGTEAVVPLPNGKSIPVDMKGVGQNNNVVVNVSVDNQGNGQTSTEAESGAQAGNLGQAIAKAVQQELQNQKRSGGILNPYGVA